MDVIVLSVKEGKLYIYGREEVIEKVLEELEKEGVRFEDVEVSSVCG